MKVNKYNILAHILLALGFLTYFLFLDIYANHRGEPDPWYIVICFMLLPLIFTTASFEIYIRLKKEKVLFEISICMLILGSILLIGFLRNIDLLASKERTNTFVCFTLFIAFSLGYPIRFYSVLGSKHKLIYALRNKLWKLKNDAKNDVPIYVILFLAIVIAFFFAGTVERWDERIFALGANRLEIFDFFDLNSLHYIHITYVYTGLIILFKSIIGNAEISLKLINLLFMVLGDIAMYRTLKILSPRLSNIDRSIIVGVYAFSPFVFGLSGASSYDYLIIVMFPWVIYAWYKDDIILFLLAAFSVMFLKEPMIVVMAGFGVGAVLEDLINGKKISDIVHNKKYWALVVMAIAWMAVFILMPTWGHIFDSSSPYGSFVTPADISGSGDGTVDTSLGIARSFGVLEFIIKKINSSYVFNFSWILSFVVFLSGIKCLIKKDNRLIVKLLPLLSADLFFMLFNFAFHTVDHPRYQNSHVAILTLCAMLSIGSIDRISVKRVVGTTIAGLLLISNFVLIDPISKLIYEGYDVGNTSMITICNPFMCDSSVYNFQYQYYIRATNKALSSVMADDRDMILICPTVDGTAYYFDGFENVKGGDEPHIRYWDNHKREISCDFRPDSTEIETYYVDNIDQLSAIASNCKKDIYFMYTPWAGSDIASELNISNYLELNTLEVNYLGTQVYIKQIGTSEIASGDI